ncbi:hypothetical protein FHT09_001901 [Xanthomonas arboricola]|nr:hypothetical protein [Xanthomonas sp. CFBP 8152]
MPSRAFWPAGSQPAGTLLASRRGCGPKNDAAAYVRISCPRTANAARRARPMAAPGSCGLPASAAHGKRIGTRRGQEDATWTSACGRLQDKNSAPWSGVALAGCVCRPQASAARSRKCAHCKARRSAAIGQAQVVVARAAMRLGPGTLANDIAYSPPAGWLHAAMPPGTRACWPVNTTTAWQADGARMTVQSRARTRV